MPKATINITPDPENNFISFSKNYRLFQQSEPIYFASSIDTFSDSVNLNSNDSTNLTRKIRYSTNKYDWSLWYNLDPLNLSSVQAIIFDLTKPLFIELKYEYDNGSNSTLSNNVIVDSAKIRFVTTSEQPDPNYEFSPKLICSDEKCPALIAERLSTFYPYATGAVIDIYRQLSFSTNIIFGHETVYFRTLPDTSSGDFIFKEWTLFNSVDRRCIKILVPNNEFPDNKPKFSDFGPDFEIPFEVHIDLTYFQSIFGRGSQPRVRDFLYFPLINRMYEIKSTYLYRGLMMQPVYWKIQLVKYQQHSDTLNRPSDATALQQLIVSSEQLFKTEINNATLDAINPKQFKTISQFKDETRDRINRDLSIKQVDMTYNYANLIEYYYDFTSISTTSQKYVLSPVLDKALTQVTGTPLGFDAYEESEIFTSWRDGFLNNYDINVPSVGFPKFIKIDGPIDSYTNGRYIRLTAYKTSNLIPSNQQDVIYSTDGTGINSTVLKGRDAAVIYKQSASIADNLTVTLLFKMAPSQTGAIILRAFDTNINNGLKIVCTLPSDNGTLTTQVIVNTSIHTFTSPNIKYDTWYAMVVPISSQFSQLAFYLYGLGQDPANVKNWNSLIPITATDTTLPTNSGFSIDTKWELVSGPYSLANLRIFNTVIQDEDHEFVLTQLYLRDESMLILVDNCKPRLNLPFISINR